MEYNKKSILVFNPSMPGNTMLPYTYGLLKSFFKNNDLAEDYIWLPPFFSSRYGQFDFSLLLKTDILLLCVYTWNKDFCLHIANELRSLNPSALIIAGGPEPDWADSNIFQKEFKNIDIISKDEVESFVTILRQHIYDKKDFQNIPNLLINFEGNRFVTPDHPKEPLPQHNGPIHELFNEYQDLLKELEEDEKTFLMAPLETNRGCPYKCSFCDWGSSTFSKIRQFSLERVYYEIKSIAKLKIPYLFLTDANFGILSRDIKIAQMIGEIKAKTGFPLSVFWSNAKNNHENVKEIFKIFSQAGFVKSSLINYQSTDAKVLEIMDRQNIDVNHLEYLLENSHKLGLPTTAVTIVGSPGENINNSIQTLEDITNNKHHSYRFNPYLLLPNAPASRREYLEKYEIKSIRRPLPVTRLRKEDYQNPYYPHVNYLISHQTMTPYDWIDLMINNAMVSGYYFMGPLKVSWDYLKRSSELKFQLEIRDFLNAIRGTSAFEHIQLVKDHLKNFLDENVSHMIPSPYSQYMLELDQFLAFSILKNKETYQKFLIEFLAHFEVTNETKESLLNLCLNYIIFPNQQEDDNQIKTSSTLLRSIFPEMKTSPNELELLFFTTPKHKQGLNSEVYISSLLTNMGGKKDKPFKEIQLFTE